jgi:carboxylate-amine ligase
MSMPTPPLTLGVEEEYQIIDPETRNLHSYITELLSLDEQRSTSLNLKPELMQSQVEVGSHVCRNIKEVRQEVIRLRRAVCAMAEENGLLIAAASTHPFAKWEEQNITEGIRYKELLDDMQRVARGLLIFGMHVHVGFGSEPESKDLMIDIMNQARYFIPHLLALSTSSPFWHGYNTGLKSYRSVVFEMLPRTGIPHSFISWAEYKAYERTLGKVGSFGKRDPVAKIWWDIRPHPLFNTLEFRISDICTKVDETICVAALFGLEESVPFHFLMEELLEIVDDVLDELGSREEVEYLRTIMREGTSADRQVAIYNKNGGDDNREEALKAVVDNLVAETKEGL